MSQDQEPAVSAPAPVAAEKEEEMTAQALLDAGTRSLAHKQFSRACDELAQAVERLVEQHGELSLETADAYLMYGQALLKMAISQSGVLGSAPKADQVEQSIEATAAAAAAPDAKQFSFHFGGDEDEDEEGQDEEEEGDEQDEEQADYDREDDLEQAFMMFESARTVWNKQQGEQYKIKEAEAHRLLGEVASESEQFENAVNEYSSALGLLQKVLPEHDRQLSELHMLIALTLEFVPEKLGQAVSHAEKARHVLELKLNKLQKLESPSEADKKEIDDLKSLMTDVDAKIEDLKLVPTEPAPTESDLTLAKMIEGAAAKVAGGPVNDLSALVKKKKKVAIVEPNQAESSGKRKAEDELENGDKKQQRTDA